MSLHDTANALHQAGQPCAWPHLSHQVPHPAISAISVFISHSPTLHSPPAASCRDLCLKHHLLEESSIAAHASYGYQSSYTLCIRCMARKQLWGMCTPPQVCSRHLEQATHGRGASWLFLSVCCHPDTNVLHRKSPKHLASWCAQGGGSLPGCIPGRGLAGRQPRQAAADRGARASTPAGGTLSKLSHVHTVTLYCSARKKRQ